MIEGPDRFDENWDFPPEDDGRPEPGFAALLFLALAVPLIGIYAHSLGMAGRSIVKVPAILLRDALVLRPMAILIVLLLAGSGLSAAAWVQDRRDQKRK